MPSLVSPELAQYIKDWISRAAQAENISVTSYPDGINRDDDWLYVPLSVTGEDAYDRAARLQQIEDLWEPSDHDGLHLLLVPAKSRMPTQNEGYAQLSELMQRQHQLIDQIDAADPNIETAQRFQAIRQEWEETLRQMERLYPSLQREVV